MNIDNDIFDELRHKWNSLKSNNDGDNSFWDIFQNSYLKNEISLLDPSKKSSFKNFSSEILFYPELISMLINKCKEHGCQLEITFFSTLLPRHYWNFPVFINDEISYFSIAKDFIDKYRESIENKANIRRVLIIGDGLETYHGINLFSVADLALDSKSFIPEDGLGKITWDEFIKQYKECNHNNYLLHIPKDKFCYLPYIKTKDVTKLENYEYVLKSLISTGEIYRFAKKGKESVYNYYINKLHSNNDTAAAKYILLGKDTKDVFHQNLRFVRTKKEDVPLNKLSLDSALIEITNISNDSKKSYILNVFMDIFNNIIRIRIIDEKDSDYGTYSDNIKDLLRISRPLPLKTKKTDRSKCDIVMFME